MILKKPRIDPRAMAPQERTGMPNDSSINPQAPGVKPVSDAFLEPELARPRPQLLREGFNRKFFGKGSDYRPGRGRVMPNPSIQENRAPAIEESLYDLDDDLG